MNLDYYIYSMKINWNTQINNMHEVLHVIGLCPDHFAHINLIDIIVANHESLIQFKPKLIIKRLWQIRS
jgi:hypothetical protein